MSPIGTSRTNRRHRVLSPIGLTTDKSGFRPATACPLMTQRRHWVAVQFKNRTIITPLLADDYRVKSNRSGIHWSPTHGSVGLGLQQRCAKDWGIVMLRKYAIALSVVSLLAGSVKESKATLSAIPVTAGASVAAGAWVTGGFIGVVAALCIYDIVLKIEGVKNWDGTPKIPKHDRHR
jgi:hypothetical protein